jgi:hypothetical protein
MYQIHRNPWTQSNDIRATVLGLLKRPAELYVESGFPSGIDIPTNVEYKSNPYPVVFLVTGAGGNGKDTWIDMIGKYCSICNLSSITECKELAVQLIEYTKALEDIMPVCGSKQHDQKSDAYRTFLNDLKTAWSKFNSGPNYNLFRQVNEIIGDQLAGKCKYDAIFLHIREYDEITEMKDLIEHKLGLLCFTMVVKGLVDPSEYTNPGDHDAESHEYDLNIINTPSKLGMLNVQAMLFAENLITANALYGYACELNKEPECNSGAATITTDSGEMVGTLSTDGTTTTFTPADASVTTMHEAISPFQVTHVKGVDPTTIKEVRDHILNKELPDFENKVKAIYQSSTENNVADKEI